MHIDTHIYIYIYNNMYTNTCDYVSGLQLNWLASCLHNCMEFARAKLDGIVWSANAEEIYALWLGEPWLHYSVLHL